jgi:flavin-dependent dehydrogenase
VPPPPAGTVAAQSPGIRSSWSTEVPITRSYGGGGEGAALNVDRAAFDRMLHDRAAAGGVACFEGMPTVDAEREADGRWRVAVRTCAGSRALLAEMLVDATGRAAILSGRAGGRARRFGDLFAAAHWLEPSDEAAGTPAATLLIEACALGWWSLGRTPAGSRVATFYTSRSMMRSRGVPPGEWAAAALPGTLHVSGELARTSFVSGSARMLPCFPALSRKVAGERWIAVGEAAAAFDPICGHGVVYALESAFRAYETVAGDGSFAAAASRYAETIGGWMDIHLARRAEVYAEAEGRFAPQFLEALGQGALAAPEARPVA